MFALGNLSKLILADRSEVPFPEAQSLLIWNEDSQDLLIVKPVNTFGGETPSSDYGTDYRTFHAQSPNQSTVVEWFKPRRNRMLTLGRISAIHYYIPAHFASAKKDKEFKHFFGDFGGEHYTHGKEYMPALTMHPERGTYYIQRLPGNAYTVDDYIRG